MLAEELDYAVGVDTHRLIGDSPRPFGKHKPPRFTGFSAREEREEEKKKKRMMGFEPTTFCMASRRSSQLSYIRAARIIARPKAPTRRRRREPVRASPVRPSKPADRPDPAFFKAGWGLRGV